MLIFIKSLIMLQFKGINIIPILYYMRKYGIRQVFEAAKM